MVQCNLCGLCEAKEIKELGNLECAKNTRSLKKCDWGQPVCSVELSSVFCLG